VRGGDTLASIAARFDISLDSLLVANNITNPNTVFAGQVLVIPSNEFGTGGPTQPGAATTVVVSPALQAQDDAAAAAAAEQAAAPAQPAAPTQPQSPAQAELRPAVVVRTGDTLGSIAAQFGVTPEAIASLNGISNINVVRAGDILVLPEGATVTNFGTGGPVATGGQQYIVEAGDVLSLVALEFGTTVEAISAVNDLGNPSRIFPGDVLLIP
ncbi:MAG: LysM peptidoglycan-binding domain-containing protein, partial [Chloroflexota bacterium]